MRCPYCSAPDSKVVDSRGGGDGKVIRRRRECLACHKRFSTFERLEPLPLMVIKSNDTREPFDPAKVRTGILKACEKRPVSIDAIEKIVSEIEYSISNYVMEVPSQIIGDMILDKLENLDPVSYLRFASVFKGFESVENFMDLAAMLKDRINKKKSSLSAGQENISGRQQASLAGEAGCPTRKSRQGNGDSASKHGERKEEVDFKPKVFSGHANKAVQRAVSESLFAGEGTDDTREESRGERNGERLGADIRIAQHGGQSSTGKNNV